LRKRLWERGHSRDGERSGGVIGMRNSCDVIQCPSEATVSRLSIDHVRRWTLMCGEKYSNLYGYYAPDNIR
jgi:hypothetical protein